MSMKTQDPLDNATKLTDPEEFSFSAQQAKAYLAEPDEFLAWHAQDPEVTLGLDGEAGNASTKTSRRCTPPPALSSLSSLC